MTRFEYIDALKQALSDLPPDVIAATVADYERRIAAASAAGQSEEAILASLDSPQKVAAERRAAKQFHAFKQDKTPANFVRMFFSFIGLMMFNIFLIVPAIIYTALLFASFAVALACYSGGIMMTATGLAGVSEISLDEHFHRDAHTPVAIRSNRDDGHVIIDIGKNAKSAPVQALPQAQMGSASASSAASTASSATASAAGNAASTRSDKIIISDDNDSLGFTEDDDGVNIDMPGLHMHSPGNSHHLFFDTDDFNESRPVLVSVGIGMILGGILMFLLCLVVSKFTVTGIVRLVQMEFSVLKNA
ncbi:MAG TPA: DUF1700 domain-containing protein [Burkholderiaceae bacterium]|jgi:uncharacterized membrane protein|nr:DUF1700 domain-containing protein [Burkholderiaceae bacterium]